MATQLETIQPTDRRVQTFFRKTEFCRFFEAGRCSKGDGCNFAHGQDEIKSTPDLTKTSMCKAWAQGSCKLSSKQCSFAHGRDELRKSRDGLRQARFKSMRRRSGGNTVFNTSEDEEGYCQKAFDSGSIFRMERELKTSTQASHGQSGTVKNAALFKYASQNTHFEKKLVNDQGLSKLKDGVPDCLWLSAPMLCALPSPTQQILLSTSLVVMAKIHTNIAACFDKTVLCKELLESMPDHYDD